MRTGTTDERLCAFWCAFVGASALGSGAAPSWARRAVAPLVARGKVDASGDDDEVGDGDDDGDDGDDGGPTTRKKVTRRKGRKAATRWATRWRVPHAWFKHFYVVGCCVNAVAIASLGSGNAGGAADDASRLALWLFQVHLIRRLYESAFVSSYRAGASMHAASYALGLAYYACASQSWAWRPPSDFVDASETNGAAGLTLALKYIGIVLFAVGNREQHRCHVILAESRRAKSSRNARTVRSYVIPRGGWFERFSCAHYTAEIVIYLGLLAVALPPRIAPLCVAHPPVVVGVSSFESSPLRRPCVSPSPPISPSPRTLTTPGTSTRSGKITPVGGPRYFRRFHRSSHVATRQPPLRGPGEESLLQ